MCFQDGSMCNLLLMKGVTGWLDPILMKGIHWLNPALMEAMIWLAGQLPTLMKKASNWLFLTWMTGKPAGPSFQGSGQAHTDWLVQMMEDHMRDIRGWQVQSMGCQWRPSLSGKGGKLLTTDFCICTHTTCVPNQKMATYNYSGQQTAKIWRTVFSSNIYIPVNRWFFSKERGVIFVEESHLQESWITWFKFFN